MLLALAPAATAAPPGNNSWGSPEDLELNDVRTALTTEATAPEGGETLPCGIGKTVWYSFIGDGGPVRITTAGSNFDTVIAVYDALPPNAPGAFVDCNDDSGNGLRSRLTVDTVDGVQYYIQLGGFGGDSGNAVIAAGSPAGNDRRSDAQALASGEPLTRPNRFAVEDDGEDLTCEPANNAPLGHTIWFRYTAPAIGDVVFTSGGTDTVMQVYRGGEGNPFVCNDDGPNEVGASRVSVRVGQGEEYFIQVGGYGQSADARVGEITMGAEFREDLDVDDDGANRMPGGADCDDRDPNRHPGVNDVPFNGVDENCRDGDAVGQIASLDLSFRVGNRRRRYWPVRRLRANPTPAGATVSFRCRGRRCPPPRTITASAEAVAARVMDLRRVFRLRRIYRGQTITMDVTHPTHFGRRYTIRARRAPALTVLCTRPDRPGTFDCVDAR